jgi:hypothetical protein
MTECLTRLTAILAALTLGAGGIFAQVDRQHDQMTARGNHAMGFDQDKTTHHFRVLPDGGAIEVTAKDAGDVASRDQIRTHLAHVARMFGDGDFSAPMFIHAASPPGRETLVRLKDQLSYTYSPTKQGGKVRISTKNPEALKAVHDFLRFQIDEHKTGDKKQ